MTASESKIQTADLPVQGEPNQAPNVAALINQFRKCSPWSAGGWNRVRHNEDVRFSRWAGQSLDCKKHGTTTTEPFPWDGASDQRSYDADDVVLTNVAELWEAFYRAWLQPKAGASEEHNYAVKLADYIINEWLADELPSEIERAAQYREGLGMMILYPGWDLQVALESRPLTLDQIEQQSLRLAQELMGPNGQMVLEAFPAATGVVRLKELILDEATEDLAAEYLQAAWEFYTLQLLERNDVQLPKLRSERLKRAVRELRESGQADLPAPYVCKDQPCLKALKPWSEVFFNDRVKCIQDAPAVFVRECVTETELRARILARGWDRGWVEAAVKYKGRVSVWQQTSEMLITPPTSLAAAMAGSAIQLWNQTDVGGDFIEVLYAVYRLLDADGVPGVYLTVMHPQVGASSSAEPVSQASSFGWHGLLKDARNRYPFVLCTREHVDEHVGASRGIPEIVNSQQRVIKANLDAIIDWASLAVNPPRNRVQQGSAVGTQYKFGPGAENVVRRHDDNQFMDIPVKGVPLGENIIELMQKRMAKYFGHEHPELAPGHGAAKRQMRASSFLLACAAGVQGMVDACQSNMDDARFAEVTGAPVGWLDARRNQFGLLAARLQFDVRELDPEYVMNMLKAWNEVIIPGDVTGIVNRTKTTNFQARMVNPRMARELIQEEAPASQQLFEGVKNDVALMFLGQEAQYVEMDPAASTKLQYLTQIVQANPNYMQGLQQAGRFAELMQKYAQNLQFSLQQQQNKQIGRIGVTPDAATK